VRDLGQLPQAESIVLSLAGMDIRLRFRSRRVDRELVRPPRCRTWSCVWSLPSPGTPQQDPPAYPVRCRLVRALTLDCRRKTTDSDRDPTLPRMQDPTEPSAFLRINACGNDFISRRSDNVKPLPKIFPLCRHRWVTGHADRHGAKLEPAKCPFS